MHLLEGITPITDETPCGQDLRAVDEWAFADLRAAAPNLITDPETGLSREDDADWEKLETLATGHLTASKDLEIVVYLLRAVLRTRDMPALRDGLVLLRDLVKHRWDQCHPTLESAGNDTQVRIRVVEVLSDFDLFLRPLAEKKFLTTDDGSFSLYDILGAKGEREMREGDPTLDQVELAFAGCSKEQKEGIEQSLAAIDESAKIVGNIENQFRSRLDASQGVAPPNLDKLADLFKRMVRETKMLLGLPIEEEEGGEEDERGGGQKQTLQGEIKSRTDVRHFLDKACRFYGDTEPASPVPMFLRAAKVVVDKDFLEISEIVTPELLKHLRQAIDKGESSG